MSQGTNPESRTEIKPKLEFPENYDLESFFTTSDGQPTLCGPDDLERTIPRRQYSASGATDPAITKANLSFIDQYWVHKPYAFVSIWRNERHEEYQYFVVEPTLSERETRVREFLEGKILDAIELQDEPASVTISEQQETIAQAVGELLDQYNMWSRSDTDGLSSSLVNTIQEKATSLVERWTGNTSEAVVGPSTAAAGETEPLSDHQTNKILYYIWRDHVWYGPINPITQDSLVEDISCNGYESPVFVDHADLGEQVLTNVMFGEQELDDYVVNLAQRAGKGISKRKPNVDATLPNGSRVQLTLGEEVSDKGTSFTIRQFREVPFTPIDLLNWETMSIDQLVYLWLAIENRQSAIVAGETASGKTTTLNALTLFIPASNKIVSIEDTRELTLAQRNHTPLETRESSSRGDTHDIDELALLKSALRMRPDYLAMGEVRGEEAQTLFQAINTGHTTYTTFHAGSAEEAINRFTSDPLNIELSQFSGVDLVLFQSVASVEGERVRRLATVEEVGEMSADDDLSYSRTFNWEPDTDTIHSYHSLSSEMLGEIQRQRGWTDHELQNEWQRRELVLAYLSQKNIDSYAAVAAILQAYMTTPATVMSRIADGTLEDRIEQLDEMGRIDVDIDAEREQDVPRPGHEALSAETKERLSEILANGSAILEEYRHMDVSLGRTDAETLEEIDAAEVDASTNGTGDDDSASDRPMLGATSSDTESGNLTETLAGAPPSDATEDTGATDQGQPSTEQATTEGTEGTETTGQTDQTDQTGESAQTDEDESENMVDVSSDGAGGGESGSLAQSGGPSDGDAEPDQGGTSDFESGADQPADPSSVAPVGTGEDDDEDEDDDRGEDGSVTRFSG